jgi:hypothetical protein
MGMFDSFWHPCRCGEDVEFQSKAGECALHDYRLGSNPPPPAVAGDLNGQSSTCRNCGRTMHITAQVILTVE